MRRSLPSIMLSLLLLLVPTAMIQILASQTSESTISSTGMIGSGQGLPWLHVEGQYVVDDLGNRVAWRGAGLDYTAYNFGWDRFRGYIRTLKGRGLNMVRLAFCVPGHRIQQTEYDPAKMDMALSIVEEYGMYAILDSHHYWATEEVEGWDDVVPKYKDEWIATWVDIATRYRDRPSIAAYELINEGLGPHDELLAVLIEGMNAIRSVDPNHMFVVFEWRNTEWQIAENFTVWKPRDKQPNTVYALHHWWTAYRNSIEPKYPEYDPTRYVNESAMAYGNAAEYVNGAMAYRRFMNAPVWLGEFGAYDRDIAHANMAETKEIIRLAESQSLGWSVWQMEVNYDWDWLVPAPYTNPYFGDPQPFAPKPFDMRTKIVDSYEIFRLDPSFIWLRNNGANVTLKDPMKIRVVIWEGWPGLGTLLSDEIVTVIDTTTVVNRFPEGQTGLDVRHTQIRPYGI
ncbi:MAG TPA: cellulase family glycosylhydrolase [Candidatus Bathyarchaeia archaeon]|nr:cellulase family glycosylhydrolase [Candidatus Bathyarchaeia archaeon]